MQHVVERVAEHSDAQAIIAAGRVPFLDSAKLKLVDGCNLKCFMCDFWHRKRVGELSTEAWFAVLDDLAGMDCRKVQLSGGEPFMRKDLLELVKRAHDHGMRVNLTTNGTLLRKDTLKPMLKLPIRNITVSVDGPVGHVHDAVRGQPGAFKRTRSFIDYVNRHRGPKTRLRVNTVVSRRNVRSLMEMPRFLRDIRADGWLLIPMDDSFQGRPDRLHDGLSAADIQMYNSRIAPTLTERASFPGFDAFPFGRQSDVELAAVGLHARGHYRTNRCWVPWFHVLVGPTGDVFPCCGTHRRIAPMGSVVDGRLVDLLRSDAWVAFRKAMAVERLAACHKCDDFLVENRLIDAALG